MKITFGDAKQSRLPRSIGACPTDDRFRDLLNESMELLLIQGHYVGTVERFRFCATDGCVTQPPQIDTLETMAVCGIPGAIRPRWYEWCSGGAGIRQSIQNTGPSSGSGGCCGNGGGSSGLNEAIDRGRFPSFGDLQGIDKKLNFVCDLLSDVGKPVLALGYDQNLNWIRTSQGGVILDGEIINLSQGAGALSVNFFSSLSGIQFNTPRDGQSWLYEYNNDTTTKRLIGKYEYFETRPSYRRYFFPSILTGTQTQPAGCVQTLVECMAKLAFIKVHQDTDYLAIPNLPALKVMLMALNEAEHEPSSLKKNQITMAGISTACQILDKQLQHEDGDGQTIGFNIVGSSVGSIDPVEQVC